jgi:CBS domain-containing protein
MKVSDVMTSKPVAVCCDASLGHAGRMMIQNGINGVPVIDYVGVLVGVVTQADLMRHVATDVGPRRQGCPEPRLVREELADRFIRMSARRVDEVMSEPISVDDAATVESAIAQMARCRVKCLPVTHAGLLCGVLSRADVIRAFLALIQPSAPPKPGAKAICEAVTDPIDRRANVGHGASLSMQGMPA